MLPWSQKAMFKNFKLSTVPEDMLRMLRNGVILRNTKKEYDVLAEFMKDVPAKKDIIAIFELLPNDPNMAAEFNEGRLMFIADVKQIDNAEFRELYNEHVEAIGLKKHETTSKLSVLLKQLYAQEINKQFSKYKEPPKTEDGYVEILQRLDLGHGRWRATDEYSSVPLLDKAKIGMDAIKKANLDDNELETKAMDLITFILHAVYQDKKTDFNEQQTLDLLRQAENHFTAEIRGIN